MGIFRFCDKQLNIWLWLNSCKLSSKWNWKTRIPDHNSDICQIVKNPEIKPFSAQFRKGFSFSIILKKIAITEIWLDIFSTHRLIRARYRLFDDNFPFLGFEDKGYFLGFCHRRIQQDLTDTSCFSIHVIDFNDLTS